MMQLHNFFNNQPRWCNVPGMGSTVGLPLSDLGKLGVLFTSESDFKHERPGDI